MALHRSVKEANVSSNYSDVRAVNDSKGKAFLTIATICGIAFLSTWAAGLVVEPFSNWPVRYRFLGVSFVFAMGATYCWARQVAWQQIAAQRYFQVLSQIDPLKLADHSRASELPYLAATNPWREAALRFTDFFRTHCQRLEQLEHTRASLEIRLNRNTLRQSQIEAILNSLAEAIVAVDQHDQVLLANPAAQRLLGIDLEATANRDLERIVHSQQLVELLTDTSHRKPPVQRTAEFELPDETGRPRPFGIAIRSFPPREGEQSSAPTGVFAVLRDTSQLKATCTRNAEFVSAVSHEMKTPLAGIKAYVELLADGDVENEQMREEFLNVINSQANRLQRLIDNLLNLARIEAGVVQVSKNVTSLNELLNEAFDIVGPAAEAKQILLAQDLSQMYIGVLVDRDMMMQAAINLLSNAIKYTPDGGTVTLRSRLAGDEAVFEVEDTGVGLSPEDQRRVFEMFYRVKKDREMAQGTGLGLPLAKHIVEDVHAGRVTVQSEPGRGSTFTISLPVAAQMTCHV
jgi:two-component system, OmpR family, phosphate regulon sensor histidine kinase PhoR